MTNSKKDQPIVEKETSADGSTVSWTIDTKGSNYNREVKGTFVQGDVYENGKKKPKV